MICKRITLKKWSPCTFSWALLYISFFSFTPDRYIHLIFNPGTEFAAFGSEFLEPAFQNSLYSDSIVWCPPVDSVISGFTVPFDSFEVVQVSGLPAGITFMCDDSDCRWVPPMPGIQTTAFLKLNGNPGLSPGGKYKIFVNVKYYFTFFGSPVALDHIDSSLIIQLCPFQKPGSELEVVQLDTDLNLGNDLVSGYYIGTNGVTANGSISSPKEIAFLGGNHVNLNQPFTVNQGAVFYAGTCPDN
ncbi:MAG: hypothetical protein HKN76_21100 [Saprospiraceae bacterium]|nr:hypothetical protein [Saprospiraceae bacterium]